MKKNNFFQKFLSLLLFFSFFCFPAISQKLAYISPYGLSFQNKISNKITCPAKPGFLRITKSKWCEIFNATHNAVKKNGLSKKLGYKKAMSIMLGLIYKESSFRDKVIGGAGEVGLTQIMPSTGRFICKMDKSKLKNIHNNLNCSTKYLNMLLSKDYFDSNLDFALMAYNQGWGNVKKGLYFEEDIRYVNLIKNKYSPIFAANI